MYSSITGEYESRVSFQKLHSLLQSEGIGLTMIKLALIGAGKWGQNYLSTVKKVPNCEIKYVCSQTSDKLQFLNDSYVRTTDYKDLFKYRDIDGVIIATPGSTHFNIAAEFLKRNFNLLIEKPLAIKYADALKLEFLKNKTSAKILVGHTYLFDPAYEKAKKLIKDIGSLRYVYYELLNIEDFRSDMSVLWDFGPHFIAFLLDIFKQEPLKIRAWGLNKLRPKTGLSDLVFINLKFPDGIQAFAKIGWLSPTKKRELVIAGSKSTIIYNDLNPKRLALYENLGPDVKSEAIVKMISNLKYPFYISKLPLEVELSEFVNAVSENRDVNKSDLNFAIKVTKILNLVEKSIRNDCEVTNDGT